MRGMNSESVDLIYLDPPFNSKANYAAPIGSQAAGAAFKDTWTLRDVDAEWINLIEAKHPALSRVLLAAMTDSDKSYLVYMAARLLEMRRLLKPTGSLYLHCDPTMSHYLKLVMDAIFGRENFQNEIIWAYRGMPTRQKRWQNKHDILLFYASKDGLAFNVQYGDPTEESRKTYESAKRVGYNANHKRMMAVVYDWSKYNQAVAQGKIPAGMRAVFTTTGNPPMTDWWSDIKILGGPKNKERTGYPTQKPLALLQRIIKASSNAGETILDPFCGCATTLVAAEDLQREWVGIDISEKAAELVVQRIKERQGLFRDITHRTDIPQRTDLGQLRPYNAPENRKLLYGEQGGDCNGCGTHFAPQHLEIDHIISRNKGGTDHIENLQLLCGSCNRIKGNRGMEYLRAKLQF